MRTPMILTALMATTLGAAAKADFVITSTPPAPNPPLASEVPLKTPVPANHPTPPRFEIANGFGDQIRLSFAVRQIVPPTVKVTYGPGADPNALVDWTGGQTWNRVLLTAVKPLDFGWCSRIRLSRYESSAVRSCIFHAAPGKPREQLCRTSNSIRSRSG